MALKDFKIGQAVSFYNQCNGFHPLLVKGRWPFTLFDAITRDIPCVVQEVYTDNADSDESLPHMIILDIQTNTKLWIEPGFNLENVRIK